MHHPHSSSSVTTKSNVKLHLSETLVLYSRVRIFSRALSRRSGEEGRSRWGRKRRENIVLVRLPLRPPSALLHSHSSPLPLLLSLSSALPRERALPPCPKKTKKHALFSPPPPPPPTDSTRSISSIFIFLSLSLSLSVPCPPFSPSPLPSSSSHLLPYFLPPPSRAPDIHVAFLLLDTDNQRATWLSSTRDLTRHR